MSLFLGIDTSNYTTSVAICTGDGKIIENLKIPLPVKQGERGLRQSDAVFAHTVNLPQIFDMLGKRDDIKAVGYSFAPRDEEGSYMPCFLAGKSVACAIASLLDVPCYCFSHQRGHIRAALYSCGADKLMAEEFIAFHVSGGTTEVLHVNNGEIKLIGGTNDLTAGQAIDRIGVKMGLSFPCGREIQALCDNESAPKKTKISVDGFYCNMSGIENMADKLYKNGGDSSEVATLTIDFIINTLDKISENLKEKYPSLPFVYSGGVMSNVKIKKYFTEKYGAYFALPEFSSDNAAGCALLTYDKEMGNVCS